MKKFVFAVLAVAFLSVSVAPQAEGQVWVTNQPVFVQPMPVTTFYAPMVVPQRVFYAPQPVWGPQPVVVGRPAAVVPPRYFYPGQPVRNMFRRNTVIW